jgi:2-polyprenyl-3-methyl-5-hydroxy-6-metoxy-1,4-benzoquinol methylase
MATTASVISIFITSLTFAPTRTASFSLPRHGLDPKRLPKRFVSATHVAGTTTGKYAVPVWCPTASLPLTQMPAGETMMSSEQHDYVLRGGASGAERLHLLAAVKWPSTKTLLDRIGLRRGMHCLDVGCGIGAVALQMAQVVGPNGWVVGVDMDEDCLAIARRECQRLALNAEFRPGTVAGLEESSAFDLVFGRFVLTHVRDPRQALSRMAQAARPEGVVVVEDIQFSGHFCFPDCVAFDRYVALYQEIVQRRGGDPNIGPRLPAMFLEARLTNVELEIVQPTYLHGPGKQIAAVTMEHIREAVVAEGLAANAEINAIVAELGTFASDPTSMMSLPRIFQVWGTRSRGKSMAPDCS